MINRIQNISPEYVTKSYHFNNDSLRSEEVKTLVDMYSKNINSILQKKQFGEDFSEQAKIISIVLEKLGIDKDKKIYNRNILSGSSNLKRIGKGQDSVVYNFSNNSKYIYKEGKESNNENLDYLKNKYFLLKKYLGDIIPKSYFILGESYDQLWDRGLKGNKFLSLKLLTIQKKVNGKDISKMTNQEKLDKNFLISLEKAHKKYILLKLFLKSILEELNIDKKSFDFQLDLGKLSNIDNFSHDNINFVQKDLKTPNIMWDGKDIYFIDFGYGNWDKNKEIVFKYMLDDKVYKRWLSLLEIIG